MIGADWRGRRVLILGYGVEGRSTHRYLVEHARPGFLAVADRRRALVFPWPVDAVIEGDDYLAHLDGFDVIVRSPGISAFAPEVVAAAARGAQLTSQTNLLLEARGDSVVGVTGTKGKSTTASLLAAMLRRAGRDVRLVGNIGVPPLDELPTATPDTIFVTEMSSYQLEDVERSPRSAILLGLASEHLDRHGSFDAYVAAKSRIFMAQDENGVLVYDQDTEADRRLVASAPGRTFGFSVDDASATSFIRDGEIVSRAGRAAGTQPTTVLRVDETPLLGTGNLRNVLAATTMALLLDVPAADIRSAVMDFRALPHRIEFVGERDGVRYYDDSIATIPEAAINAIDALGTDVATLIAGGYDRGIDFEGFGAYLAGRPHIRTLILFDPSGIRIADALQAHLGAGDRRTIFHVTTMEEAAALARLHTPPGRICLMSPASASFGTFEDYRDRGQQFRERLGLG
jgi:UDP-N-acetylmuramoylalanine--D-glutamate ligase